MINFIIRCVCVCAEWQEHIMVATFVNNIGVIADIMIVSCLFLLRIGVIGRFTVGITKCRFSFFECSSSFYIGYWRGQHESYLPSANGEYADRYRDECSDAAYDDRNQ